MIRNSAISAYSEHDDQVMADSEFDAMQIPLDVSDWGKIENDRMDELKQAGMVVFARSAYLQSLVLMDPQNLPEKMAFVKPTLEKH